MLTQNSILKILGVCALAAFAVACGTTKSFNPSIYENSNVEKIKLDIVPEIRVFGSGGGGAAVALFGLVGAAVVSATNRSTQNASRSGLEQVAATLSPDEINEEVEKLVEKAFFDSLYPVNPTFVKSSNVHFNTFGVSLKYSIGFTSNIDQLHSEILFITNLGKGTQSIRSYQSIFSTPDRSTDRAENFRYWTGDNSNTAKNAIASSFAELEKLLRDDLTAAVQVQSNEKTIYFNNGAANVGAKPIQTYSDRISVACRVPAYSGCYAVLPTSSLKTADEVDPLKISGATVD